MPTAFTYPQLDEYESTATVTGIWSMNPDGTDIKILDHAPSGVFTPLIASDGRLDLHPLGSSAARSAEQRGHARLRRLQLPVGVERDATADQRRGLPRAAPPAVGQLPARAHDSTSSSPGRSTRTAPVSRPSTTSAATSSAATSTPSHDGLPEFIAPENRRRTDLFLQLKEDPLRPGYFYGTKAPEFATHAAGQIVGINGHESVNADDMQIDYITDPISEDIVDDGQTPPITHPGHFRSPLPLSDGTLIAVRTTSPFADRAESGPLSSRYDFHLVQLQTGGTYCHAGSRLIPNGISKSISYWDNYGYQQVSYSGPLWELDPVEVRARTRPATRSDPLPSIESQILSDELGGSAGIERLRAFLRAQNLALIVSRNVTRRADRQQDFNLAIAGGGTSTALPGSTPVQIAFLQFFQGDLIRGYSNFHGGRRVLAKEMHDGLLPASRRSAAEQRAPWRPTAAWPPSSPPAARSVGSSRRRPAIPSCANVTG